LDNKKSFGDFITQKRRKAGLTQKGFADRLYVTESAVSKWERGLSYPDISLIRDICEVLGVSEHELLTASEDLETRNLERQAQKYIRLVNGYKFTFYLLYGVSLLICLICNLVTQHRLSWFFIVLTSELVAFSLTSLPVLAEKRRGLVTLGGFTLSLVLLLMTCSIYTHGDWFFTALVSVLFGLTVVFLPIILNSIRLSESISRQKTLLCFAVDTVLLFLLLYVCDLYTRGGWFLSTALPIASFTLLWPWAMMAVIRYPRINAFFKTSGCFAVTAVFDFYVNGVLNMILGEKTYYFGYRFDFHNWNDLTINDNVNAIIFFSLLGVAALFLIAGILVMVRTSVRAADTARKAD
jgi:Predicted transcriptional regulators